MGLEVWSQINILSWKETYTERNAMRETIDKTVNALSKQEEQQRQLRVGGKVEGEHRKNGK